MGQFEVGYVDFLGSYEAFGTNTTGTNDNYFGGGAPAWIPTGNAPESIPGLAKASGPTGLDTDNGSVYGHTPGILDGQGHVIRWTAPATETVSLAAHLWDLIDQSALEIPDSPRAQRFEVRHNGNVIKQGGLLLQEQGFNSTRKMPVAVQNLAVNAGDTLDVFVAMGQSNTPLGDFVGHDVVVSQGASNGTTPDYARSMASDFIADFSSGPGGLPTNNPNGSWAYLASGDTDAASPTLIATANATGAGSGWTEVGTASGYTRNGAFSLHGPGQRGIGMAGHGPNRIVWTAPDDINLGGVELSGYLLQQDFESARQMQLRVYKNDIAGTGTPVVTLNAIVPGSGQEDMAAAFANDFSNGLPQNNPNGNWTYYASGDSQGNPTLVATDNVGPDLGIGSGWEDTNTIIGYARGGPHGMGPGAGDAIVSHVNTGGESGNKIDFDVPADGTFDLAMTLQQPFEPTRSIRFDVYKNDFDGADPANLLGRLDVPLGELNTKHENTLTDVALLDSDTLTLIVDGAGEGGNNEGTFAGFNLVLTDSAAGEQGGSWMDMAYMETTQVAISPRDTLTTFIDGAGPLGDGQDTFSSWDVIIREVELGGTVSLTGDYNGDGTVGTEDYTIWRDKLGTTDVLPNDPIGGEIGLGQYNNWSSNFGTTTGGGSSAAVPEPATLLMAISTLLAGLLSIRRREN